MYLLNFMSVTVIESKNWELKMSVPFAFGFPPLLFFSF